MKNLNFLLIILFFIGSNVTFAQDENKETVTETEFRISGEFRPRFEYKHGTQRMVGEDATALSFISQRTRLNFCYNTKQFKTKLVLQDVRTWGNQKQLVTNEETSASIHEAWAQVFFTDKLSLKAGRQEVIYDDHRIFGSVGWADQARSHDIAIFKLKGSFNLDLGIAYNEDDKDPTSYKLTYKSLQFLHFNKKFGSLALSFLALNVRTDPNANNIIQNQQTFGPRLAYKSGKLGASLNFYMQVADDHTDKEQNAYDLGIDVSYKISSALTVAAGYELLSGTAYDETEKNTSFTPLYGTNHKFNGWMDYFYVGNAAGAGLSDIFVNIKFKPGKYYFGAKVHMFSTAAEVQDPANPGSALSKGLGTEIDFYGGYILSKQVSIKFGYSQLVGATETMEAIRGGDKDETQNWGWLMLTVKPTFFVNKK